MLVLAVCTGLAAMALTVHTLWGNVQTDSATTAQRMQDLEILLVIVLGLSALYTIFFLVSPSLNERILRQQADTVEELRGLKQEMEKLMREQTRNIQDAMQERTAPQPLRPAMDTGGPLNGREYLLLAGRVRTIERELVRIYEALATLFSDRDLSAARSFLHQALSLAPDAAVTAEIHYELGCLLAKSGEMDEAAEEIRASFRNKSRDLEKRLAKDTEEGGPLYVLANTAPGDVILNDLLMSLSVGS